MPGQNNINLPNTLSPISLSHQSSPLKDFSNMRIIQKNIVYVIGLTASLANQEVLSSFNFFGQYGIILKIVINQSGYTQKYQNDVTYSAYVTYSSKEEASLALLCIDNCTVDSHTIRCSFGTTKYCNFFLKGVDCINRECLYLHEWADEEDMIAKEDIIGGNKQLFHEQQKIALKIADIFNKEKKMKILSRKRKGNEFGFPSVESVYKKEFIYELAKSVNKEKNKKKWLYLDVSKKNNVDSLEVNYNENNIKQYDEELEYVLVKESKKKKKCNKTNLKYQNIKNSIISNSSKSSDSTLETISTSSKSNYDLLNYQKVQRSRFDFVSDDEEESKGIEVPEYINELIVQSLSSFVNKDNKSVNKTYLIKTLNKSNVNKENTNTVL